MKLVVRVADDEGTVFVSLDKGPGSPNGDGQLRKLECMAGDLLGPLEKPQPGTEPVREVGERLLDALRAHPSIGASLQTALTAGDVCPIYLRHVTPGPTRFPWETLCDHELSFLALQGQYPIARIADFNLGAKTTQYVSPPIRILAILSAVGVDAAEEWHELLGCVQRADVDVRLHVVVGQHDVGRDIEATGDPRISCAYLTSKRDVKREIRRFDPHVLHVFCHGRAEPAPMLILGRPQDHVTQRSTVWLEANDLRNVAPNAWLAVLNCCEGAGSPEGVRAIAHLLVSAGYPAVVGMREPIASNHATLFTSAFYDVLLQELADELEGGTEVELELATLLNEPRQALRDEFVGELEPHQAAAQRKEWTYPVLYVRPEPLRVSPQARDDAANGKRLYLSARLTGLQRARLEMHADTPQEYLDRLDQEIAGVQQELAAP